MTQKPLHYCWELTLQSSPEQLWDYVADTDRLNHDIGFSKITRLDQGATPNNRRVAQQTIQGFLVQQWTEEPFQWVKPYHYNTLRDYTKGIFDVIRQQLDMTPTAEGGTDIVYQIWVTPRYGLLRGLINSSFANMGFPALFRKYDKIIQAQQQVTVSPAIYVGEVSFVEGGEQRLPRLREDLIRHGAEPELAKRLTDYISQVDDLAAETIRPYELADTWQTPRRDTLETCLLATRVGLLDMRWDLLCPLCRGAKARVDALADVTQTTHCEVCNIDYDANFEQSVELTFQPSQQLRHIQNTEYCVGGPEVTPHIEIQQLLAPGESRTVSGQLAPGRYRVRTMTLKGGQFFRVKPGGDDRLTLRASAVDGWANDEPYVRPAATFTLTNQTNTEQLILIEHLIWSDQSVTAAEVTTRQVFRDLFSSEALRPNDQIAISNLTFVFTDLLSSTQMYQEVGDAPAFGLVMEHFDILRACIREEDGTIVKTIGDAVMAVFRQPEKAVRAMLRAREELAKPESLNRVITLRVGIHRGKAIAVTLNDQLDYFGTTINIAARLEGQSDGTDLIISDQVYDDPNVQQFLAGQAEALAVTSYQAELKGFAYESFTLWRLRPHPQAHPHTK